MTEIIEGDKLERFNSGRQAGFTLVRGYRVPKPSIPPPPPDVTPPPVVIPPPVVEVTNNYRFNTYHDGAASTECQISIEFTGVVGPWTIKDGGVLLADSTGFMALGVRPNKWERPGILFERTGDHAFCEYEIDITCDTIILQGYPDEVSGQGIEILNFPDCINNFRYYMRRVPITKLPTVLPRHITSLESMFWDGQVMTSDLVGWDTSNITNMYQLFSMDWSPFNQDIGGWDVSNVTNMGSMFSRCILFNQDLSGWDVSNVTKMGGMFNDCKAFNQDLSQWNVRNVTNMDSMFRGAYEFKNNLTGWDVGKIAERPSEFSSLGTFIEPIWGTDPSTDVIGVIEPTSTVFRTVMVSYKQTRLDIKIKGLVDNFTLLSSIPIIPDANKTPVSYTSSYDTYSDVWTIGIAITSPVKTYELIAAAEAITFENWTYGGFSSADDYVIGDFQLINPSTLVGRYAYRLTNVRIIETTP